MRKGKGSLNALLKTIRLMWLAAPLNMFFILLLNILSGIIVPVNLLLWKKFLDSVIIAVKDGNINNVLLWLGLYSTLLILQDILMFVYEYLKDMHSDFLNKHITEMLLTKINELDLEDFDDATIYDKINKVNGEALSRSISTTNNLIGFIKNSISIIGTVGVLGSYNIILIFASVLTYLPVVLTNIRISGKLHEIFEQRIEKLRLVENLKWLQIRYENIKEIQIFNVGEFLKNIISDTYNDYIKEDKKIRKKNMWNLSGINIIHYVTSYILKAGIIILGVKEKSSIGSITMYITSLDIFQQSFSNMMAALSGLYHDNLYIKTLFELLNRTSKNQDMARTYKIKKIYTIEFQNVYFKYPNSEKYILENISIKFYAEKSYLLVGENGAGKTTFIKLLSGLYKPTNGRILINGINMEEYEREDIRKLFCAVFQDYIRYPLDVESNIKIGNIGDWDNDKKMKELVEYFGIKKMIKDLPLQYNTQLLNEWKDSTELSGGQWQKLAICRGLYSEAPVLIMDEPTSALDAKSENILLNSVKNISKEKMCLMISHRYTSAKIVDEIIVLGNKTIKEKGTFEELMDLKGEFAELFSLQAQKYWGDV